MMKKFTLLVLSFFLVVFGGGLALAAECENPESITFSIIPTEETIQELTIYKPVIDYLSKMTGKKSRVLYAHLLCHRCGSHG
jgi:phosphonate transport system substrate-binding protein